MSGVEFSCPPPPSLHCFSYFTLILSLQMTGVEISSSLPWINCLLFFNCRCLTLRSPARVPLRCFPFYFYSIVYVGRWDLQRAAPITALLSHFTFIQLQMSGVEISSPLPPSLPCSHCILVSSRVGPADRLLDSQNIIIYLLPGIATLLISLRFFIIPPILSVFG